jgi:hypothetical protein
MDKVINRDIPPKNKDAVSVESDQQKRDNSLLIIFHQNIRGIKNQKNLYVTYYLTRHRYYV